VGHRLGRRRPHRHHGHDRLAEQYALQPSRRAGGGRTPGRGARRAANRHRENRGASGSGTALSLEGRHGAGPRGPERTPPARRPVPRLTRRLVAADPRRAVLLRRPAGFHLVGTRADVPGPLGRRPGSIGRRRGKHARVPGVDDHTGRQFRAAARSGRAAPPARRDDVVPDRVPRRPARPMVSGRRHTRAGDARGERPDGVGRVHLRSR